MLLHSIPKHWKGGALSAVAYPKTHIQGAQKMSQVLQMLEIYKILIFRIYEFFWRPSMTRTCSKQATKCDCDGEKNKFYLNINGKFYPLVNDIIRLSGYQW